MTDIKKKHVIKGFTAYNVVTKEHLCIYPVETELKALQLAYGKPLWAVGDSEMVKQNAIVAVKCELTIFID